MGKKRTIELLGKVAEMQASEIKRLEEALQAKSEICTVEATVGNGVAAPNVNRIGEMTWAKASVETIKRLLSDHYDGRLNIYDFWGIGDEREIYLGGGLKQTVKMVLTDKARYRIFPDGINNDPVFCAFCVDQKNVLTDNYRCINADCTNDGGWEACELRKWLNGEYVRALPKEYAPKEYGGIFKEFELEVEKNVFDYFALRSEVEIFGEGVCGPKDSGRQIEWYKQTRNRIKLDGSDSAESKSYWERTVYRDNTCSFCRVDRSGSANNYTSGTDYGVAPFGCI